MKTVRRMLVWVTVSMLVTTAAIAAPGDITRGFMVVWERGVGAQYVWCDINRAKVRAYEDSYYKKGLRMTWINIRKPDDSYCAVWRSGSGGEYIHRGSVDNFKSVDDGFRKKGYSLRTLDYRDGQVYAVYKAGSEKQKWFINTSRDYIENYWKLTAEAFGSPQLIRVDGSDRESTIISNSGSSDLHFDISPQELIDLQNNINSQKGMGILYADLWEGDRTVPELHITASVGYSMKESTSVAFYQNPNDFHNAVVSGFKHGMRVRTVVTYDVLEPLGPPTTKWACNYSVSVKNTQCPGGAPQFYGDGCGPTPDAALANAKAALSNALGECLSSDGKPTANCCGYTLAP